jgi:L-alanine-DL-glutamate epimerase-like enolase superfamily enzyme
MKITAAEVYRKDLPLDEPIKHFSAGTVTALEEVYVILRTDAGLSGYGEVRGNSHYLTGDTPDRVCSEILGYLAPRLLGRDPRELNAILAEIDGAVIGLHGAKSGIDIALHDLAAKAHGVSVFELLGGAVRDELPSNQTLWYGPPEAAAQKAATYVAEGFRYIKVRAGLRPFEKDVDRIQAVREAIGEDISLAIDPNMGWEAREAVRCLRKLERFNLSYVEQPVAHTDFAGMRYVTQNAGIPVMADESIQSISDVFVMARDRAADILHLKMIKLGGIDGVRRAAAVAESAGLQLMVGQTNEGALATTAAAHCARAIHSDYLELYGSQGLMEDPTGGFSLKGGMATFPIAPGLGVVPDERALQRVGTMELD